MSQEQQGSQNQSKEEKKIIIAYDNAMAKAIALLKGEKNFKPVSSIPSTQMSEIMEEFFGEEIQAKKLEFKTKLKDLLKKKVAYDRFIVEKEAEFKKITLGKKKEFTKQMNDVLNIVSGIDKLKADYEAALTEPSDTTSQEQ